MRKYSFIFFLCIILTVTCILCPYGAANDIDVFPAPGIAPAEPEPIVSPTFKIHSKDPLVVETGEKKIISMSEDEEKELRNWISSDVTVVTVDSGGRIDAKSAGTATVIAVLNGNKKYECRVTVSEPKNKEKADRFSTSITANEDTLKKNLSDGRGKNPYSIYVNRKMNCVTVYTYDKNGKYNVPVRAMVCSCGKNNGTITGDFGIYFKNKWHPLFDNVYGNYVSGISGDYLFHSVPYYSPRSDMLETEEFNKLGTSASLGCVRLSSSDTKWIYDNCAYNTPVKIYDSDNAGPLGKPESIKITDLKCGWDPTDSSKSNPYYSKNPKIKGTESCTIKKGGSFYPLGGVTAVDTCSNDITDKISVFGNVVTSRAGRYKVTYSVTDVLHRTEEKEITVTVVE